MKKILVVFFAIACIALMTSAAFASQTFDSGNSTVLGSVIFTPSTSVKVNVYSNTSSDSPPNQYCVVSWHTSALNQASGREFGAFGGGNQTNSIQYTTLNTILAGWTCSSEQAFSGGSWQVQ